MELSIAEVERPIADVEEPIADAEEPTADAELPAADVEMAIADVEMPIGDQDAAAAEGELEETYEAESSDDDVFGAPMAPTGLTVLYGSVDAMSFDLIEGWVWNPENPDETCTVEVYDGADLLLRVPANEFRLDVRNAGFGTGNYGFKITNLSALLPFARHKIAVRRASDGVDLPGSPQWIERATAELDVSCIQFLESATSASVNVARTPGELDGHIAIALRVLNKLLNARSALGDGRPIASDPRLQDLLYEAELSDWTRELVTKVESSYAPIYFNDVDAPLVSVVIPVYNKFQVTYNCLKSIAENLPKCGFEIIIVDDCSKDETLFAGFVLSGAVRLIRNARNLGFVGSCNAGAAAGRGKYLLFLNNDTLVRPGWLDELVATFDNVPNVGIAGSKLLFENGSLQEVGGIIWRLGDGWNWGREKDPKDPKFSYLRDSDYVSGAALMIERELFEKLEGFDKYYMPAYYEDTDLAFRVRALGKRVVVQPASEIVHLEGISAGKDVTGSGMKRYQLINHRKFYERWKDTLSLHRFNGQQPELEAERTVKRRAYFIDDSVPTPDQDAGSNAALQHMLALMRLGYKVTFLPADNMAQINPYTANLQKLGIECLYAPYYWSVEEVFRKAAIKPDLVYLHRYTNASKYANLVHQHFPACFTVYNVADLHFLRQERETAIEGSIGTAVKLSKETELAAMRAVDSIIVHSYVEAEILREANPALRVHVVPWAVKPRPPTKSFAERSGYAFVGGYSHRPNVDAAVHLARDIVPLVKASHGTFTAYIVGSKAPPEVTALECEQVKVVGFVPDLTHFMHQLRCTIAPLRYGAGLKGKILDSMAHGLPCVMSEVAAEGFHLPTELEWLIARSPKEMAEKLIAVHEDAALNERLSRCGLEYIEREFSTEAIQRLVGEAILRQEGPKGE